MSKFKKIISLILSVVLVLAILPFSSFAKSDAVNDPIIYVRGDGATLYKADGTVLSKSFDTSKIVDKVKSVIFPYLINCITRGTDEDYQLYYDKFEEAVRPVYEQWQPNEDGEVVDGSGTLDRDSVLSSMSVDKVTDDTYIHDYYFNYDPRVDTFITADFLNECIQTVKSATGRQKVQLHVVCLGGPVALTYLAKYGTDDISSIMMDTSLATGSVTLTALATASINLDGDAIQRTVNDESFKAQQNNTSMAELFPFLKATVEILNQYKVIDMLKVGVTPFLNKIKKELMPRLFMASYGTCPGYWATVNVDKFDEAVKTTFAVKDYSTRYAGLIEKIERYHNEVAVNAEKILTEAQNNNVNIGVISKYGWATIPIFDTKDEIGDHVVLCKDSSFGATCGKAEKRLSDEYITAQTEKGLGKYISPDKMVDASSCLFPDKTWFVKGIYHEQYDCTSELVTEFFKRNGNFTVNDSSRWTQFLVLDKASENSEGGLKCIPMTTKNMNDTHWVTGEKPAKQSYTLTFVKWFVELCKTMIRLIKGLFSKIGK